MSGQRAPLIPDGGMTRSQFLRLTAAGAAMALGAPTVAQAASAGSPKRGGQIRLGNTAPITTFQPYVVGDNATVWNLLLIYDQLTRPTADGLSIQPSLAESWEISPDGKTYTFHLRPGVKFHDGSPLTAEDVAYCINQAAFNKATVWNFLFGDFKTMEAVDTLTVRAHLINPHSPFLADMALYGCSIYPKRLAGKALWAHPIGTGPFMFSSLVSGGELVLARNPNFWRNNGQPYIDTFHNLVVPDGNTRALQVQTGELDIAVYISPAIAKSFQGSPNVTVHVDPFMESHFISMNTSLTNPPLNNKLVRQAMNYAVDKNAIVDKVLFGYAKPSGQALPVMFGYDPSLAPYPYDPAKAKALLAQAGHANGFSCNLYLDGGDPNSTAVGTVVQQQLAQIGIKMSLQPIESATLNNVFAGNPPYKYQMRTNEMSADIIDPDELINYAVRGDGGQYAIFTMYNNPTVNKLIVDAGRTSDKALRQKFYYQAERLNHDDAPLIFLYSISNITLSTPAVQGFHSLPTGNYRLEEVWLQS
jgi:peptide/nickel transport system substrate-binding protein